MTTKLSAHCRASANTLLSTAEVLDTLPEGAIQADVLAQTAAALDAIGGHLDRLIEQLANNTTPPVAD